MTLVRTFATAGRVLGQIRHDHRTVALLLVVPSLLIGLVAWVAAWGGVMLVHYFWIEKRWPGDASRLFDAVGTKRLPGVNWAGIVSLLIGIFATWLFMYGLVPAMQGPIAVALGGWDLSWLAGGLSSAASYAVLGPRMHRKFLAGAGLEPAAAPVTADRPTTPAVSL